MRANNGPSARRGRFTFPEFGSTFRERREPEMGPGEFQKETIYPSLKSNRTNRCVHFEDIFSV